MTEGILFNGVGKELKFIVNKLVEELSMEYSSSPDEIEAFIENALNVIFILESKGLVNGKLSTAIEKVKNDGDIVSRNLWSALLNYDGAGLFRNQEQFTSKNSGDFETEKLHLRYLPCFERFDPSNEKVDKNINTEFMILSNVITNKFNSTYNFKGGLSCTPENLANYVVNLSSDVDFLTNIMKRTKNSKNPICNEIYVLIKKKLNSKYGGVCVDDHHSEENIRNPHIEYNKPKKININIPSTGLDMDGDARCVVDDKDKDLLQLILSSKANVNVDASTVIDFYSIILKNKDTKTGEFLKKIMKIVLE